MRCLASVTWFKRVEEGEYDGDNGYEDDSEEEGDAEEGEESEGE
jgi:hypothetical protein